MRVLPAIIACAGIGLLAACATTPPSVAVENPPLAIELPPLHKPERPVIAFALGGGAARGFAHVGVLKTLDEHGIEADIVVGTSAGSVAGVLYAGGIRGNRLVKAALSLEREEVTDWGLPDRGIIRGELLQEKINELLGQRPIEALDKVFAAVATELQSSRLTAFTRGNAGMAVRASSSVPGLVRPVTINGRDYVDGMLVSQVPVKVARKLGADIVIAVDVSRAPFQRNTFNSTLEVLHQSWLIMSQTMVDIDTKDADVLIRPRLDMINIANFDLRSYAIAEGSRAADMVIHRIQRLIDTRTRAMQLKPRTPSRGEKAAPAGR